MGCAEEGMWVRSPLAVGRMLVTPKCGGYVATYGICGQGVPKPSESWRYWVARRLVGVDRRVEVLRRIAEKVVDRWRTAVEEWVGGLQTVAAEALSRGRTDSVLAVLEVVQRRKGLLEVAEKRKTILAVEARCLVLFQAQELGD